VSAGGSRAVFLDRDGVLVRAPVVAGRPHSIRDVGDLELEAGAREACVALREAGFVLVGVTNQPDVARGLLEPAALDAIHERLLGLLPLEEIAACPHDDADACTCRKPEPGLLVDAATRLDLDLGASYMVGDRWRDVKAGRRAGCTTVFVDREYSEPLPENADMTVRDITEAAAWILERRRP
jgi:D-glycero-D-manno-heptose 1,7-bisphosphate phosphatase